MAKLHDIKVHVRIRIAMLWAAIMFLYIYNDIFSLYVPGALQGVMAGKMGDFPPTSPELLLVFALSMVPACLMVFLSVVLWAPAARWANVGVGLFYAVFVAWTLVMPEAWSFYLVLAAIEVALSLLIVWLAWTWSRESAV